MTMDTPQDGLILLKCRGCKTPTLFRLQACHEAETDYIAGTHCKKCENQDPLRGLCVRSLEPALVESQRLEPVCHETDPREGSQ